MTYAARQPVAGPDHDDVEVAAAGVGHHAVQRRAAGAGARDAVIDILLDDLEPTLLGQQAQVVNLRLRVLVDRAYAQVQGGAAHQNRSRSVISSRRAVTAWLRKRRRGRLGSGLDTSTSASSWNNCMTRPARRICWWIWERVG